MFQNDYFNLYMFETNKYFLFLILFVAWKLTKQNIIYHIADICRYVTNCGFTH